MFTVAFYDNTTGEFLGYVSRGRSAGSLFVRDIRKAQRMTRDGAHMAKARSEAFRDDRRVEVVKVEVK